VRRGAAVAAAAVAALLAPLAATAAVHVRSVDMSGYPRVRVTVVTSKPTTAPPRLSENRQAAAGLTTENLGRAKSVVLAIDRSQSMRGKPLQEAVAAARRFVADKPALDRIAVTTFATHVVMLTGFSSSTIDADTALRTIDQVDSKPGTKLYDDLVASAQALAQQKLLGRVIIVVTDGNETTSTAGLKDVVAAARKARAAIYVIGIESSLFNPKDLKLLAADTGGRYYGTSSAASLRSVYASIADELKRTWRLDYISAAQPGDHVKLAVWVPGAGTVKTALTVPQSAQPAGPGSSPLPSAAFGSWVPLVLALAVALLVLLGVGLTVATRQGDRLREQLAPHVGRAADRKREKASGRDRLMAFAGLFRLTERAFGQSKQWLKVKRLLERADIPLKTVEFFYVCVGTAIVLSLFAAFVGMGSLLAFAALIVGGFLPVGFVVYKARKRVTAFERQLPDLLMSIAASLKAGHSFKQGLQAVVDEGMEPAAKELKRVLTETRLGRPMEDALEEMADRVGSKNVSFIVTAVNVQNQVGGSLAGLFDMVADTVRQRQQFAAKIKGLTAMGRMSAYVLMGLPFLMAGAITLLNPSYMSPLFHTSTGHTLIIVGLTMMLIGSLFLKKIVSFRG
jgi:tight adherence protein B